MLKVNKNQYQNVEYNSIYCHAKFESNWLINIQMHAIKVFWWLTLWPQGKVKVSISGIKW